MQLLEKHKQYFDISATNFLTKGFHSKRERSVYICQVIDHLRNRLNFDLNKSRQKFHHSLKEHHKISNIPKFRCEML
jgi:hypothetical protein